LGCALYFCLTGQVPFPEGTAVEKMMAHQTKQPPPIKELSPETPAPLVAVVDRLMQKAPTARFGSAAEVIEALRPLASGAPAPGSPFAPRPSPVVQGLRLENGSPRSVADTPRPPSGPTPTLSRPVTAPPARTAPAASAPAPTPAPPPSRPPVAPAPVPLPTRESLHRGPAGRPAAADLPSSMPREYSMENLTEPPKPFMERMEEKLGTAGLAILAGLIAVVVFFIMFTMMKK
jgi:serine/threonine-protein kinase